MTTCVQCGDTHPRDRMLSLDSWIDPPENPDCVCIRCALVALKGGPKALTADERERLGVVVG